MNNRKKQKITELNKKFNEYASISKLSDDYLLNFIFGGDYDDNYSDAGDWGQFRWKRHINDKK